MCAHTDKAEHISSITKKTFPSVFSVISAVVGSGPQAEKGIHCHGCAPEHCLGAEEAQLEAGTDLESLIEQSNSQNIDRPRCVQGHTGRSMDVREG